MNAVEADILRIRPDQVRLGSMLGMGSFSEVYAVDLKVDAVVQVVVEKEEEEEDQEDTVSVSSIVTDSTGFLSSNSSVRTVATKKQQQQQHQPRSVRGYQYALKRLRANRTEPSTLKEEKNDKGACSRSYGAAQAIQDLMWEVELLRHKLPAHVNIISLIGVSDGFFQTPEAGFFILERVSETLEFRLKRWKLKADRYQERTWERRRSSLSLFRRLFGPRTRAKKIDLDYERHQQLHRLESCAVGIARAMEHLHAHGILYRDLKPANIGFAANGSVRLFDFGMAVSLLPPTQQRQQGHCCLVVQGFAGTPAYMAPEVARLQPYGFPADVYSFGLLLWHICTLDAPYTSSSSSKSNHKKTTMDLANWATTRPTLMPIVWPEIRTWIARCWDPNPELRPSFDQLSPLLHAFLRTGGIAQQKIE